MSATTTFSKALTALTVATVILALVAPPARWDGEAGAFGPVPGLDQQGAALRAEFAP